MIGPPDLKAGESLALVRSVFRCPDPVDLFRACDGGRPGTVLLETADSAENDPGKSLVVAGSALRIRCYGQHVETRALGPNGLALLPWLAGRLQPLVDVERRDDTLTCAFAELERCDEEQRLKAPSPIEVIRGLLRGLAGRISQPSAAPLVVGTLAYDLLGVYEKLPASGNDPLGWPDYEMWLPDRLIWIDHRRRTTTVVGHVFGGESYADIVGAVEQLVAAVADDRPPAARGRSATPLIELPLKVDLEDTAFAELVERLKQHIIAGDVFQIVPSRSYSLPCRDPLGAYRRLRAFNPSPYMFFVAGSRGQLFGASPETALKVDGDPLEVQIRPIAGTRPRGRRPDGTIDPDLDSRLEVALRFNEKEVAEHMMLVDLARNDVARVCQAGTRRVDQLLAVERFSHVMHLVSRVSGRLRRDLDALHAYVATMNMGTLVGAPKLRAAELLRQHEVTRRGPYGGAVGYFTADGRMDSGIVIRAAVVDQGVAHVRAGAGVVYDSDPRAEAHETERKAAAVIEAIRQAEAGVA